MSFERVIPKLLTWYELEKRELPWRDTLNPYYIWVSEIILQQTRVNQGLPYYFKFVDKFPKIYDLAVADEEEVLKIWQGLGYYSRARNMQKAANVVINDLDGKFPENFTSIKKLPGVGDYTAAAIASFAFEEPVPVVDGNVKRVFARFLGINENIQSGKFQTAVFAHLSGVIPKRKPSIFNQAMMELGALVCTPKKPDCENCPIAEYCIAKSKNLQNELPVIIKKTKVQKRTIHYLFIKDKEQNCSIQKRPTNSIWGGLYEFPNFEKNSISFPYELLDIVEFKCAVEVKVPEKPLGMTTHKLSHQSINAILWFLEVEQIVENQSNKCVRIANLNNFPIHKLMLKFVDWIHD